MLLLSVYFDQRGHRVDPEKENSHYIVGLRNPAVELLEKQEKIFLFHYPRSSLVVLFLLALYFSISIILHIFSFSLLPNKFSLEIILFLPPSFFFKYTYIFGSMLFRYNFFPKPCFYFSYFFIILFLFTYIIVSELKKLSPRYIKPYNTKNRFSSSFVSYYII